MTIKVVRAYLKYTLYIAVVVFIAGCARHHINIIPDDVEVMKFLPGNIAVIPLEDLRPEEERRDKSEKFLAFSSKDKHFDESVSDALTRSIVDEFRANGLDAFILPEKKEMGSDFVLSGKIRHFQVIVKLPNTTVVPYLSTVASLWSSDQYSTAVTLHIELTDKNGNVLINEEFNISEELKLKTGPLNVARVGRGMQYKLKLLDIALKDVVFQIAEQARTNIEKTLQ